MVEPHSVRNFRNYDFMKISLFNILEVFQKLVLAIIFGVRIFRVFEILEKLPFCWDLIIILGKSI